MNHSLGCGGTVQEVHFSSERIFTDIRNQDAVCGGLKWVARGAGSKALTVGPDGTVYVA